MKLKTLLILVVMICALIGTGNPGFAQAAAGVEEVFDSIKTTSADPNAQIRFLPENVNSWYARWKIMEDAKKSIDMTYFIVEQDIFGMSMLGMLLKKAREGVNIRIMIDARGTKGLTRKLLGQDVMQEMARLKNVQIRTFNPVAQKLVALFDDIRKIMASNHDKLLLTDGEYLITGGRNISKSYFVDPRDLTGVYRDTDILIKSGIVAKQAKQAFDEEFSSGGNFKITGDLLGNADKMARDLDLAYHTMRRHMLGMGSFKVDPAKYSKDTVALLKKYSDELANYKNLRDFSGFRLFQGERAYPTKILDKHSISGPRNDITSNLVRFIDAAKEEVLIQNPYVVLTKEAEAALQRANDRRVRVVIQTNSPMSSDSLLTQAMFLNDWKTVLKNMPNAEIHAYKLESKLHSKVFVFDRKIAVIGTYNMDYVSEQINSEVVAVVKSQPFARQVALRIGEDIKHSHQYKIQVGDKGDVKVLFGPESHSDPKVLSRLNWLQKLHWLKPLI